MSVSRMEYFTEIVGIEDLKIGDEIGFVNFSDKTSDRGVLTEIGKFAQSITLDGGRTWLVSGGYLFRYITKHKITVVLVSPDSEIMADCTCGWEGTFHRPEDLHFVWSQHNRETGK